MIKPYSESRFSSRVGQFIEYMNKINQKMILDKDPNSGPENEFKDFENRAALKTWIESLYGEFELELNYL